jgi:hypothetical protein
MDSMLEASHSFSHTLLQQAMDSISKEVAITYASTGSLGTWTCTISFTNESGDKVKIQIECSSTESLPNEHWIKR